MKYYDVKGYDRPLRLSPEHAEVLNATEHALPTEQPKTSAAKQEWVDYAIAQGVDPAVAVGMTRADLIEQYGG